MFFLTGNFHRLFLLQNMKAFDNGGVTTATQFSHGSQRKNNTSHFSLHQQKWFEDLFEHLTRCFWPPLAFNIGIAMLRGLRFTRTAYLNRIIPQKFHFTLENWPSCFVIQ